MVPLLAAQDAQWRGINVGCLRGTFTGCPCRLLASSIVERATRPDSINGRDTYTVYLSQPNIVRLE